MQPYMFASKVRGFGLRAWKRESRSRSQADFKPRPWVPLESKMLQFLRNFIQLDGLRAMREQFGQTFDAKAEVELERKKAQYV
jgi:hypothetical protein